MTEHQQAKVGLALLMFAQKHGWEQLNEQEQQLARLAMANQKNLRYMDLYVQSTTTALQINRAERSQGSA